jgi:uncharacterized protein with von Willebrand factor type A (vWA) domain
MPEPAGSDPVLFDGALFAARLSQALRDAGVPVTPDRASLFLKALRILPPVRRTDLYWTARHAFVGTREQVEAFDRVFAALFNAAADGPALPDARSAPEAPTPYTSPSGQPPPADTPRPPPVAESSLPGGAPRSDAADRQGGRRDESTARRLFGSVSEAFAHKDFAAFTADELAALDRLFDALAVHFPVRRGRRRAPDPAGRHADLRRSLRQSMRTGGEPFRLARSRNRPRRRPLVLLCDVSGSMEAYTRAYLRFFSRVCARSAGTVPAEAFVFATRLTRLTAALKHADPDTALSRAGAKATDWSGGTLIGAALAEFNRRHGRRGMARGAVVVVFSDGWEGADPARVGAEMRRLSLLAHRLVWVNPRKAAPGYVPLAGGMAAALPYCDTFASGHSLAALAELVDAIADTGRR